MTKAKPTDKAKGKQRIIQGNCIEVMRDFPSESVDFVLTDPPYGVNYKDRSGRSIANDGDQTNWMQPAFSEIYRVMKPNSLCVCFYGWTKLEDFMTAWRLAGFRRVAHLTFPKRYTSSMTFVRYMHENAFLLAKGRPNPPQHPPDDVLDFPYSGNALHPTQKPLAVLIPLIEAFTNKGDLVLDPFCGSGSTCAAAKILGRRYMGIELDPAYRDAAQKRIDDYNVISS